MATVAIRLELGANAPLDHVATSIDHLNTLCQFGSQLQRVVDRNEAIYQVMRRPSAYLRELAFEDDPGLWPPYGYGRIVAGLSGPGAVPLPALEAAVARRLDQTEARARAEVRVERLSYENPLELVITATGLAILGILALIRDWPARRRANTAIAAGIESDAAARKRVQDLVIDQLASGQLHLSPEQVTQLLTTDVVAAMLALGQQPPTVSGLDDESVRG